MQRYIVGCVLTLLLMPLWAGAADETLQRLEHALEQARTDYNQQIHVKRLAKTILAAEQARLATAQQRLTQAGMEVERNRQLSEASGASDAKRNAFLGSLVEQRAAQEEVDERQQAVATAQERLQQAHDQLKVLTGKVHQTKIEIGEHQFTLLRQQLEQERKITARVKLLCDEDQSIRACKEDVRNKTFEQAKALGSNVLLSNARSLEKQGAVGEIVQQLRTQVQGVVLHHNVLEEGFTPQGHYLYAIEAVVRGQLLPSLHDTFLRGQGIATVGSSMSAGDILQTEGDSMWVEPQTGIEFIDIPQGCFQMGSDEADNEKPVRHVCVGRFWMSKTEITQAQWDVVMDDNPSRFKGANNPVEHVTWHDTQAFMRKLGQGIRLPTEAEWEYAARAGSEGKYSKDVEGQEVTQDTLSDYAWYGKSWESGHRSVAQKQPNAFGLYDMHGNVWEWTCSIYAAPYNGAEKVCAQDKDAEQNRVYRGGSWGHFPNGVRAAMRADLIPTRHHYAIGFRLVRVH